MNKPNEKKDGFTPTIAAEGDTNEKPFVHDSLGYDTKGIITLLVLLASAISLPYYRILNEFFFDVHPAWVSLIAGAIATLIALPVLLYASPLYGLSDAVLIGLLIAEFSVYGAVVTFPTPVQISFFFYMFSLGRSEAQNLWPSK